jgi:hypothetical protein
LKEEEMNAKRKILAASFAVLAFMSASVAAQDVTPQAPFTSVGLDGCGKVTISHGSTRRVTLLNGDANYSQVTITDGNRLMLKSCRLKCPKGCSPQVSSSITRGGVVEKGSPGDADKPVTDSHSSVPAVPAVPNLKTQAVNWPKH